MRSYTLENLPLGFRFKPTDEELINHYLRGKINGVIFDEDVIPEIEVIKFEPWDLPGKSLIRTSDKEWFFFSPRDQKYPTCKRLNRATKAGYWKPTGKDRRIKSKSSESKLIGMKKTLVFHRGRAPKGQGTSWIIHEYRMIEDGVDDKEYGQAAFVLCRLFQGPSKKNDVDHSSPDEAQHAGNAGEQVWTPLYQKPTKSDMQGDPQQLDWSHFMVEDELPADVVTWLCKEADNGMSLPPALSSIAQGHEIELDAAEMDQVLEALERYQHDPFLMDYQGLPSDYKAGERQHMGLFQDNSAEKDASSSSPIKKLLDEALSDSASEENAAVYSIRVCDPWETELDIDNSPMQSFRMRPAERARPEALVGFCPEPENCKVVYEGKTETSYPNASQFHDDIAGLHVLPGYSKKSMHHEIKQPDSRKDSASGSSNLQGTGVEIRSRKLHHVAPSHKHVAQGQAPRRIRLQVKVHRWSGKAKDSSIRAKENEINSATTKPSSNVHDHDIKGEQGFRHAHLDKLANLRKKVREISSSKLQSLTHDFARKASLGNDGNVEKISCANNACEWSGMARQSDQKSKSKTSETLLQPVEREERRRGKSTTREAWMAKLGSESQEMWETEKRKADGGHSPIILDEQFIKAGQKVRMKLHGFLEKHREHKHHWRKLKLKKKPDL